QDLMELNQNLEERVKLELKKVDKQNQLLIQKTKLESLGELAAGMAHEINQPLGGISMSLDNIMFNKLEGKLTNEYLDGKIDLMFQDIERIRNIINHIRVFSRDQQEEMNDVVNLIQVVNNTLSLVNRLYFDHHVDLVISLDKKHSMFIGNSIKLEQVLINMLSNAKYAVDKKATTDPTYVKRISIKSRGQNNNIIIDITDNGIGIPEEYINRIFDPFFSTKSASDGTGLGLSISYGLIKEMNGSIEVDSQVNEFTRLTITLPEYIK
ncbi:MAG: ATP-binding protein, partial [Bacteroidales bacterium]|nr:ATP-binding protein [Bacteroidales bacterium]